MTKKLIKKSRNNTHNLNHDTLVTIGRVIKARGLRGEIKVEPLSNVLDRFKFLHEIILELKNGENINFNIEYSRISGVNIILKLNGIDDRDAAEKLRSAYINVTLDNVAPLDDNSYYIFDLEGMGVFDSSNNKIGFVTRIEQYPANDVIVVEKATEEIIIPAIKEFIVGIDLKSKKLTVNLPEGLPRYPKEGKKNE